MEQRALERKLYNANCTHRTSKAITEAADIDSQQTAKNDSYSRFVRNDQDIAIRKLALDFVNHAEAARGYRDGQLAGGGRMPGWIGKPTDIVVVIFTVYVFPGLSFPFAIGDLI